MTEIRVRTEGMDKVLANINKRLTKIKGATVAGLLEAGLMIQTRSQKRVPREYGNLINSAFTRKAIDDPNAVEVGYGAAYAFYVHENMEQKWKGQPRKSGLGVYWGPAGEPKYLEKTLRESQRDILLVVAKRAGQ